MESKRTEPRSSQKKQQGVVGISIHFIVSIVLMSFLAWFCMWAGFAVYQFFQGESRAQFQINSIIESNANLLKSENYFLIGNAYEVFESVEKKIIYESLIKTHALDALKWIKKKIQKSCEFIEKKSPKLKNTAINDWNHILHPVFNIFLESAVIIGMRLLIFLLSLPLFLLFVCLGCVDGLVQRDIRKFQAARESTYFFHRLKRTWKFCFFIPLFLYFIWPYAISAAWFLMPMAIVLSVMIQLSLKSFKKYV